LKKTSPKLLRQRAQMACVAIRKAKMAIESADITIRQQRVVLYKINQQLTAQGESQYPYED